MKTLTTKRLSALFAPLEHYEIDHEGRVFHKTKGEITPISLGYATRELMAKDPLWEFREGGKRPELILETPEGSFACAIHLPPEVLAYATEHTSWKKEFGRSEQNPQVAFEQKPRQTWFEPNPVPLVGDKEKGWIRIENPTLGFCVFHGPSRTFAGVNTNPV